MPDPDLCPGHPCAVAVPHLAHGTRYLSADQVTRVWRPGLRPPIAQYTLTVAVTGDDLGMDALGAVIPPILRANLGMSSVHVTDIRSGYPAAPAPAATDRPVVRIHDGYNRTVVVYLNGTQLATGNYDEHGWAGLDMIRNLATQIAEFGGLTVVRCEGESYEHCTDGDHDV